MANDCNIVMCQYACGVANKPCNVRDKRVRLAMQLIMLSIRERNIYYYYRHYTLL